MGKCYIYQFGDKFGRKIYHQNVWMEGDIRGEQPWDDMLTTGEEFVSILGVSKKCGSRGGGPLLEILTIRIKYSYGGYGQARLQHQGIRFIG